MEQLLPIGILFTVALFLCLGILLITHLLGPKNTQTTHLSTYECGIIPEGSARIPFKSSFYLIAVLFLLFDVETTFFLPWALVYKDSLAEGPGLLIAMIVYLGLTVLGLVYILRKNTLRLNSR